MRSAFLCLILAAGILSAQSFEVASIKRAAPVSGFVKGPQEGSVSFSGDSLSLRNVSLREIILLAYSIKDHQLVGPGSVDSDRYDVMAKSASVATKEQMATMLRGFLAERFKLEIHRETKELAVMAMTVGKSAPKLGDAKPEGPAATGIDQGKLTFQNYSMAKLADYLSKRSGGRPVVDATGIEGFYDFGVLIADGNDPIAVKKALGMGMQDGSFARTIAEGIGLRLDARHGPVEVVVVDHVEKAPTEN